MTTPLHNANGHRRRQLTKRVKAEEHHCALCGDPVDKTLTMDWGKHGPKCQDGDCRGCVPHPMRGEVDEDLPRSRGGSPYSRANTHLLHRLCNQTKGKLTLAEARLKLQGQHQAPVRPPVAASPIW